MPQLGKVISAPASRKGDRTPANNKRKISDGTREAEIIDVWIFNVDDDGKFTKNDTGQQKASIKIRFDRRPDIVLEKRMRAYLSSKSMFAKLIQTLTGLEPGSDAMMQFDADSLVGMKVLVTTAYDPSKEVGDEPGYTNITAITPAVKEESEDF